MLFRRSGEPKALRQYTTFIRNGDMEQMKIFNFAGSVRPMRITVRLLLDVCLFLTPQ